MKINVAFCSIFTLILTWSCQTYDVTDDTVNQNIIISNITDSEATLKWSNDIDTTKNNTYFELWVNDALIKKLSENSDTIYGLFHKTQYQIKIVAIEDGTRKYAIESNFTTSENFPPSDLTISFDSLMSQSVVLIRDDAKDPERKALQYDVYVNGISQSINQTEKRLLLSNLKPNMLNSIRVTVRDNMNNTTNVSKTILTPNSPNSLLYRYYLDVEGIKRECVLYLPKNYNQSSNLPLLFCFHGAGSYGWDMALFTYFNEIADRDNVIIAYPQSSINSFTKHTSWCVDPGYPNDDLPFADKLIDNLLSNFSINSKRVYACGFSSGGYMSFYMAMMLSNKLAAIAPVSGNPHRLNFSKKTIKEPMPLLYIYGTKDGGFAGDYESLSAKETLDFWIVNNGCDSIPLETQIPHKLQSPTTVTLFEYLNTTNSESNILYYQINEGDHWWPGHNYSPCDIVAETVIWDFFKDIYKP